MNPRLNEPMKLTKERKNRVEHLLKQAALLLIEAQLEMLMDTPSIYEHELSKRLSPELFNLYKTTEEAETTVVSAQNSLTRL